MKHISTKIILCLIIFSAYFASCTFKADVDLNNVDLTTSVNTSLSIPLGSVSAKFGDFIGANSVQNITIDEQGRYLFLDTLHLSRSYHPIDISEYVSKTSAKWYLEDYIDQVKTQLEDEIKKYLEDEIKQLYPGFNIDIDLDEYLEMLEYIPIPGGLSFDIEFPITLDLTKLNIDFDYQRVDSVIVDSALFTSQYTFHNIDFDWKSIKKIQLILNDNFRNIANDTIDLLQDGKGFGQPMPIEISKFHLLLMKDPTAESSGDNIVDSVTLKIRFQIENSSPLKIYRNSYIGYDFELNFIDYSAMFGYFAASTLMSDIMQERAINELWNDWQVFDGWMLPASEPSVTFIVNHSLAVPMVVNLKHIYTKSETGEQCYATFDESKTQRSTSIHWPMQIAMTDPLEKHAYNTIVLDYTPENGNIDTLLSIHPHSVSYALEIATDSTSDIKQFRITDNTDINLSAILNIPFAFHDSVRITYSDTLKNINLSQLQLDSLLQEVEIIEEVKDAELHLYVLIENGIPFDIKGDFTLYDANDNIVQLSTMHEPYFTLDIKYPDLVEDGATSTPSANHLPLIKIKKDDFAALASVKYILFNAELGNNHDPVALTPDAAMRIAVGVTADINAILDLEKLK